MANIIEEKSFAFAIRIVNLYKHLNEKRIRFVQATFTKWNEYWRERSRSRTSTKHS